MTGANMNLVTVDVELPEDAPKPTQKLDEGEHIVQRVVPLKELDAALRGESESTAEKEVLMADYAKKGFAVDALVASVATGLSIVQ